MDYASATGEDGDKHAFAGVHQSFLNVGGREAILGAISRCYASLWTPQAVAYRRRFAIPDEDVRCGVIICKMIAAPNAGEPVAAGVVFTADPTDGRRDRIVIEAVAGLGDKLVSGQATPARICFDVRPEGLGPQQGEAAALPRPLACRLARLAYRVHWACGDGDKPQDIEWAFDGEDVFIVQARPITALPRRTFPALAEQPVIWTNANFKEVLPGVLTPMAWSFLSNTISAHLFDVVRLAGFTPPEGIRIVRRIEGRSYLDASALQYANYAAFGVPPSEFKSAFGGFQPEISIPESNPLRGRAGLRLLLGRLKVTRDLWRLPNALPAQIEKVEARAKDLCRRDLRLLPNADLVRLWLDMAGTDWQFPFMLANAIGLTWFGEARKLAAKCLPVDEAMSLLSGLMSGQGGVVSAEHAYELQEIACRHPPSGPEFEKAIQAYLEKFGHRGFDELEVANPRWAETPDAVKRLARSLANAPHDPETARRIRQEARGALRALPLIARLTLGWMIRKAEEGFRVREQAKSGLVAITAAVRHVLLEIGRRCIERGILDQPDDIFLLADIDAWALMTDEWAGAGARELVEDRRKQRDAWIASEPPPDVIVETAAGAAPVAHVVPSQSQSGGALQGMAASPGVAQGSARKLRKPNEAELLREGGILVARTTDPGWTPLFLLAQGIVVEIGGYLSHGAIVAREFGVPAVVNVAGAFDKIADGADIVVDGDKGLVTQPMG